MNLQLAIVAVWIVSALTSWELARRRGFDAWIPWVVSGIIFGPLAVLFALMVPSASEVADAYDAAEEPATPAAGRPRCPSCRRPHSAGTRYCPNCGAVV